MEQKQEQTLFKDLQHWQDIDIEKIQKDQESSVIIVRDSTLTKIKHSM